MIIRKYGITLNRLKVSDLELVRKMRNKRSIKDRMFYQKEISTEEQTAWFQTIKNSKHYYFIIEVDGKKVGLIHGKVRSFEERIGEGGLFIWDENYYSTPVPVIASICMADLTFLIMKMDKTIAEVRMDNKVAIDYNLKLGYRITDRIEADQKLILELDKASYFSKAQKIRSQVKKLGKDDTDLSWNDITFHEDDPAEYFHDIPDYLAEHLNKKNKD